MPGARSAAAGKKSQGFTWFRFLGFGCFFNARNDSLRKVFAWLVRNTLILTLDRLPEGPAYAYALFVVFRAWGKNLNAIFGMHAVASKVLVSGCFF